MTDTPRPSHWEQLAKEIGAEGGSAKSPSRPAAPAPAPTRRASEAPRTAPRPTADWSQLVSELGVTPAQPPARRPEKSAAPPARPAPREEARREAPPAPRPPQQQSEPRHRHEPPRPAEPARFERDDFDILERDEPPRGFTNSEVESAETVEFSIRDVPEEPREGTSEEGPPKDGRRRRRRRRGRGRGRSGDRPPSEQREPEVWDIDAAPAREPVEEADDVETLSRPAPTERSEEGPRGEEKGRRRRRRRRGGRRNDEPRESDSPRDESRTERPREDELSHARDDDDDLSHTREDEDFDQLPDLAAESDHAELDDEDDVDMKANHRGIPTWDEAIGMIVGANMEARARNPNGPSGQRGRRGHNRGRSHGR